MNEAPMMTKKFLLGLMAASLFAFAAQSPVYAQDADDGTTMDEPMEPSTDDSDDAGSDASDDGSEEE